MIGVATGAGAGARGDAPAIVAAGFGDGGACPTVFGAAAFEFCGLNVLLLAYPHSGVHAALHFAGHGYFQAREPGRSGLVCAGGEVLRGSDLDGLGDLPALVFFNACEAARVRRRGSPSGRRLAAFRQSTSVAEAFLSGGVANFLGTHWPVGDEAAFAFSGRFYERLLAGATLGEAVLAARRLVFEQGSIDWADYVHYGTPSFRLRPHSE